MKMKLFLLLASFLLSLCAVALVPVKSPHNFEAAKKIAKLIWNDHRETFYCSCRYDKHGLIDFSSCNYQPSDPRKSKAISWEHIVPVSWYGRGLECWHNQLCTSKNGTKYGGRRCCRKLSKEFRDMEADLYNLVPEIREINNVRSDYVFGEFYFIDKTSNKFKTSGCNVVIDERYRVIEPADEVKGMIARIHFYMAKKYGILLTEQQQRLMTDWNQRFPSSDWEKQWRQKVAIWQGEIE